MTERGQMGEELRGMMAKVRQMVEKYGRAKGYSLNGDEDVVATVIEGLARNRLRFGLPYCPCVVVSGDREKDRDIVCPCAAHKDDLARNGMCHCALYVDPNHQPQ